MAKKKKDETVRVIYSMDQEQSRFGFDDLAEATRIAEAMGPKDSDERRIRVRYRNRTGKYDVVVKVRTEIVDAPPMTREEIEIGRHANLEGER